MSKESQWHNLLLQKFGNIILYCGIHTGSSNTKISTLFDCQSENRFIFIEMKIKHPVHMLVFGVVTSDGDVVVSIILYGLTFQHEGLHSAPLDREGGRSYIWQKDSAPCNTSRRIQVWSSKNFCADTTPNICLPNSPDCNLLDYYVSVAVKSDTKDKLKARIKAAFANLNNIIGNVCMIFQSQEALVEANGDFLEWI